MSSHQEKEPRRQIKKELDRKERGQFLHALPVQQQIILELFDHLDLRLQSQGCRHDYTITSAFLGSKGIAFREQITGWFQENGGYCDCEILHNIEEKFE